MRPFIDRDTFARALPGLSTDERAELMAIAERMGRRKAFGAMLFTPQKAFVKDPARFKIAVTSRRAGKSTACAEYLLETAMEFPRSVNLYITKTRITAKRILWATIKDMIKDYGLPAEANESELKITFSNGAVIYLLGAHDKGKIEEFRGLKIRLVVLDEGQSLPQYLRELVDSVLAPALMDDRGTLCIIGTPPPVAAGYFHECWKSKSFTKHHWTVLDNPHIPHAMEAIRGECERKGVSIDDPTVQREWLGRWVNDTNNLVFRYDPTINDFASLPAGEWQTVMGVDLGYDDADAIAVLAFSSRSPNVYLLEEHVLDKQTVTQLAAKLAPLVERHKPIVTVIDTGGLGRKIAEEITQRTGIPIQAAEKTRKLEFIELLNDATRSGRFFARADSQFATDAMLVEWDRDKSLGEKRVISEAFHSDILDAALYAYRESLHWLYREPAPVVKHGTPEWFKKEESEMERNIELGLQRKMDELEEMGFAHAWE